VLFGISVDSMFGFVSDHHHIIGPLIVLVEGRLDFAEIYCGVSGPKIHVLGGLVSGNLIYHRPWPIWCPDK
jgi:hypothetical protein